MAMISALVLTLLLMACGGSNKPENMLIGNWLSNYNDIAIFEEDGRCTAPFTYNASWGESADHYIFKEDGTLVFSSSEGHAGGTYDKAETAEEALSLIHISEPTRRTPISYAVFCLKKKKNSKKKK